MSPRVVIVAWLAVFVPSPVFAQRYDLGQRLRMMERAWEAATPANRTKSVEPLKKAVTLFFTGKAPEAAAALDAARFCLLGIDSPSPAIRWANSLVVRPAARLIDPADGPLKVVVTQYYDLKEPRPEGASIRFSVLRDTGEQILGEWNLTSLPSPGSLAIEKLPVGDYRLIAEVVIQGQPVARLATMLSIVPDFKGRMDRLAVAAAALPEQATTRRLTLQSLRALVRAMAENYELETDFPAARLLTEAETLAKPDGDRTLLSPGRGGEYWLTLATPSGPASVRLMVPEKLKVDHPSPLLVAMHGAGGSENLFFDGYGDGETVRQCRQKGWFMVATRAGGFLGAMPPVAEIVDELAKYYPIDPKRIYIVGHSMGAAHTAAVAQASPGRFAAIAALGGGGSVRKPAAIKALPVFVGCGNQDFALSAAKSLVASLEKAAADVQYREYPNVEHLVIVQAAIRDVVAFFDQSRKPSANQ